MHVLFLRRGRNRSTRRKSTQAWGEHANFNTVRTDLGSNPQPQNCEADLLTKVMVRLLLCAQQCTTPAHVRQRTSSGQLSVTLHVPGSSTCPETPPAPPRSEHDTEADLSNAEANETGQEKRGCHCQETDMCSPGTGLLRHSFRQEMCPELY
ncbi:uncharacterized protein LOC144190159 isoform X2 [Stigmatopora nigra]